MSNINAPSYVVAAAHLLLPLIFVLLGLGKPGALDGTRAYMEAMGVPGALLLPTMAFEVGAGLPVVLGYRTRIVATMLAGFAWSARHGSTTTWPTRSR
jgi:putative oxidoreductase